MSDVAQKRFGIQTARIVGEPTGSGPDECAVVVEVTNRGSEVVGPIYLAVSDLGNRAANELLLDDYDTWPSIAPGEKWGVVVAARGAGWHPREISIVCFLLLRDAAGYWLARRGDGPVRLLRSVDRRVLTDQLGPQADPQRLVTSVLYRREPRFPGAGAGIK
ncbi:hypothetical protein ACIQC8_06205 [Agrococcus sediminis]|uniref:hypothetical protein n=1 Tax=Agrococcus sediminis TaxID=2599924 RepID=UPI003816C689